jgi:hypothetical protein
VAGATKTLEISYRPGPRRGANRRSAAEATTSLGAGLTGVECETVERPG